MVFVVNNSAYASKKKCEASYSSSKGHTYLHPMRRWRELIYAHVAVCLLLISLYNITRPMSSDSASRGDTNSKALIRAKEDNNGTSWEEGHRSPHAAANIPRSIWFTSKENVLETKVPMHLYINLQKTITSYRDSWGEPAAPVHFLDDEECAAHVAQAHPDLERFFYGEKQGMYKADICRVAALYNYGGYYFDIDMEVVEPLVHDSTLSFITVIESQGMGFFQSFLASSPGHPILKEALHQMVSYYVWQERKNRSWLETTALSLFKRLDTTWLMGTRTLKEAFDNTPESARGEVLLLQELNLSPVWLVDQIGRDMVTYMDSIYPELPRRHGPGLGCCCNLVVHDPVVQKVYFWSRVVGSHAC